MLTRTPGKRTRVCRGSNQSESRFSMSSRGVGSGTGASHAVEKHSSLPRKSITEKMEDSPTLLRESLQHKTQAQYGRVAHCGLRRWESSQFLLSSVPRFLPLMPWKLELIEGCRIVKGHRSLPCLGGKHAASSVRCLTSAYRTHSKMISHRRY